MAGNTMMGEFDMFDRTPADGWSRHAPSDPGRSDPDPPHSNPDTLLAAVGLPNRAIREVLGNPPGIGADG